MKNNEIELLKKIGRPTGTKKLTRKNFAIKCQGFLDHYKNKKWIKKEFIRSGERAGTLIDIPVPVPMTQEALCLFLGITRETLNQYSSDDRYSDIVKYMKMLMYTQKFEGACVGDFNWNIIARELGLREGVDVANPDGSLKPITNVLVVHTDQKEYESKLKALE